MHPPVHCGTRAVPGFAGSELCLRVFRTRLKQATCSTVVLFSYQLINHGGQSLLPAEYRVPLLVAVKMYKLPVARRIGPAHAPWVLMVTLEFLTLKDEIPATDWTTPILGFG